MNSMRGFLRERLCGLVCNWVYIGYTYGSNIHFGASCLLGAVPISFCVLEFLRTCARLLLGYINTLFGDIQAFFMVYVWQKLHYEKMNIVNSMYDNVTHVTLNPSLLLTVAAFVWSAYTSVPWFFGFLPKPQTMLKCINYVTISIYVLLLFTAIMPNLLCLSGDPTEQRQCANGLSVAYPSFTALLASTKPDVIVLTIIGFLVLVFEFMPSNFKIHLQSLFSVLSECLKSIFVHMCFVTIVLATHGNLDSVTTCCFLLVWIVVESVQVYFNNRQENLSKKLMLILCNIVLPKNFCPVSHTPFLDAPDVNVSKEYKRGMGFTLQDQQSEMTLICYRILPGSCPDKLDKPVYLFVAGIIDLLIVSAFWRHQVLDRRTESADANEQLEQHIKKLTSAADPDAKKKIMAEVVAEQNQNSNSFFGKNLRTCYYALLVFCRLRFWCSSWLDWCWQWGFESAFAWYTD